MAGFQKRRTADRIGRGCTVTGGSLDKYDNDMGTSGMVILEPPSMDQRVANQYSFFSVVLSDLNDVDSFLEETENTIKYVINKDIRWHLRDALDQMNINERMIYPGLDGVARVEGRHYYVRDEREHGMDQMSERLVTYGLGKG